jgi:hypothetical protein
LMHAPFNGVHISVSPLLQFLTTGTPHFPLEKGQKKKP